MPSIYEISDDLRALGELLAESLGEVTPDAEAALAEFERELEANLHAKLDSYCGLIRELELRSEARRAEADRIATLARRDEMAATALRSRLLAVFRERRLPPQTTTRFSVRLSRNGGVAPVEFDTADFETLPDRFRVATWRADTKAVRAALEAGEPLGFARLRERGERIDIR